ncbi:hypothetical protein ABWK22_21300 [Gottfriedia acidiceleris]|uniref:hypothetical protein n=1 Tax=Gottfriedia acidiceleris TaxID=371036 RepID=UPI003393C0F1
MKNKKRFLALFLLLVVGISVFIYQHQTDTNTNAETVKEKIGQSKKLTKNDIKTAFDTVKKEFKKNKYNKGCKITDIRYSEKEAIAIEPTLNYMNDKNVIVVFGTIKTGPSVDGGWEPNKTMDDFSWTLVRDSKNGKWRIENSGYAYSGAVNLYVS